MRGQPRNLQDGSQVAPSPIDQDALENRGIEFREAIP